MPGSGLHVIKPLKQTSFQSKDRGTSWTVIIESPISKRMRVPPTSSIWTRMDEAFKNSFSISTSISFTHTHTHTTKACFVMFFPMLPIKVFHYGSDSFSVFFLLFFPFFKIWFLMFGLEVMNLNFHKNKDIWWWEKKRRRYPGYLLITHQRIRGGLKSAWVFQAVSRVFLQHLTSSKASPFNRYRHRWGWWSGGILCREGKSFWHQTLNSFSSFLLLSH